MEGPQSSLSADLPLDREERPAQGVRGKENEPYSKDSKCCFIGQEWSLLEPLGAGPGVQGEAMQVMEDTGECEAKSRAEGML